MNNLLKHIIYLTIILLLHYPVKAQFSQPKFSFGIVNSDIHLSESDRKSEKNRNADDNSSKTGFYGTISTEYQLLTWLSLEGGISYQERLPLELFTFYMGSNGIPAESAIHVFAGFPTSPQSNLWDSSIYKRLPNFKYLNLEVVPMFSFGQQLNFQIGFGVFYGYLLNHKKLIFTREDFPTFDDFFEPPFNAYGEDTYHKHDFGWMPKVSISYPIKPKIKLGISAKGYISQYGLKKYRESNFGNKFNRQLNTTWQVLALGINIQYSLTKK